ncbi:MAG: FGGY-family carbohydrate kinase [Oscillospiraceae bacterium]|nr:FGGY-family carbohydrate kinase [Oscillospiraceae bacterium]
MLVLALESSTSSSKALLYDTEQGVVGLAQEPYDPSFCSGGKTDTHAAFAHTMAMGRKVAAGKPVAAIALCSTWHSIGVCDKDFSPITPTFAWNYMAPAAQCRAMRADPALCRLLYQKTGCMPHVTYPRHALLYEQSQGLDLSGKLLLSQGAYNLYQLTGEFAESINVMSGSGLMDVAALRYDALPMDLLGIRPSQLGALVTYRDTFPLHAAGAKLLGISAGIPVVPAHSDGALNQIANGAGQPGRMTFSVGTSGAIRMSTKAPVLPEGQQLWSYYGVDNYISGGAVAGACSCVNWFKDAVLGGALSFGQLEAMPLHLARPPVFLPFTFGERCPGWRDDRVGGLVDLMPEHTVADWYYAVQAGPLFNLLQCYKVLQQAVGTPSDVIVSGGVLNSRRWTQMIADIFQTRILCVQNIHASAVGAAVLAMHACGAMPRISDFTRDFDEASAVLPDPSRYPFYEAWYAAYLCAYNAGI